MDELTQRGITALRSGNRSLARTLLGEAVRQNPNNAAAWLWLTGALDHDEERIDCLKQVLRIDPDNQPAARGLSQIMARQAEKAAQAGSEHPYARQAEQKAASHAPAVAEDTEPSADPVTEEAASDPEEESPISVQAERLVEEQPPAPISPDVQAVGALVFETPPAGDSTTAPQTDVAGVNIPGPDPVEQPMVLTPPVTTARRRRARAAEPTQTIFRTRPSLVPALFGFWVFLFGSIAVGVLLDSVTPLGLPISAGLGFILILIVIYAVVVNFSTRYELTNHYLALRHRGQRVRVPIEEISQANCRQTFFQRMIGTGDVLLKAAVTHELTTLRMRNIPDCRRKVEQIRAAAAISDTQT